MHHQNSLNSFKLSVSQLLPCCLLVEAGCLLCTAVMPSGWGRVSHSCTLHGKTNFYNSSVLDCLPLNPVSGVDFFFLLTTPFECLSDTFFQCDFRRHIVLFLFLFFCLVFPSSLSEPFPVRSSDSSREQQPPSWTVYLCLLCVFLFQRHDCWECKTHHDSAWYPCLIIWS